MVVDQASGLFETAGSIAWKIAIVLAGLGYIALLIIAIVYPLLRKKHKPVSLELHKETIMPEEIPIPVYNKIAVALDFSEHDQKLIVNAIGQSNKNSSFVLIHIVESASARLLGNESDDMETRKDQERLDNYVAQLKSKGFNAVGILGYQSRAKEIIRIIKEEKADMLVIGAHRHTGIKDLIYGETVNTVRHEINVPVLIVNL